MRDKPWTALIKQYEYELHKPRKEIADFSKSLLLKNKQEFWYAFLIIYCDQGVSMTEMVPSWISRAADAMVERGYGELGSVLATHAQHEADHHLLYIEDVNALHNQACSKFGPIDLAALKVENMLPSVVDYRNFHEEIIGSISPYRQIALEYEIEQLSVAIGKTLVEHIISVCGPDVVKGLSFVNEHVALDVGHTKYNRALLEKLFLTEPKTTLISIETGTKILRIFRQYLQEVLLAAEDKHKLFQKK